MNTDRLKASWAEAAAAGDMVPQYFYSHLFVSHPEVRSMFPVSMATQRDRLVGALGRVVSSVDRVDEVVGYIQQLGRDHRKFAVVTEHYSAVGASLLATLKHFLGERWTAELAADWAQAYQLIATTMVQAAEQSAEDTPDWWTAEVLSVERRSLDIAILTVAPEPRLPYRPGQSVTIEVPQRPRSWRFLSPANAPRPDGSIEFHVQLVDGGQVSTSIVRSLKPGEKVKLGAPVGDRLVRPADPTSELLMVAGGTGLAPLRAVLEEIELDHRAGKPVANVEFYHGARVPWSLYDQQRLEAFGRYEWFSYTPVISDDDSYPGQRGLVGAVAARQAKLDGRVAMVCGSPRMVKHTVAELTAAGMPPDRIRHETFETGDVPE
ncbi:MAG: oxidoreductase [Microlunatus sp.]|nr:oxidoreductase [Microlunatus sp.]